MTAVLRGDCSDISFSTVIFAAAMGLEWPTNYSEHILKKTSSSKEAYGKFCFDVDS